MRAVPNLSRTKVLCGIDGNASRGSHTSERYSLIKSIMRPSAGQ